MRDFLTEIYNILIQDEFITKYINPSEDIYFNKYPDTYTLNRSVIVINEFNDPLNQAYGDDRSLASSQLIDVDVFTKVSPKYNARLLRNELSERISDLLEEKLRMSHVSSSKPEYDDDLKLYRSVRTYEGTYYKNIVKSY